MQTQFYVSSQDQELGPFGIQEIAKKLQDGELQPTDYLFLESVEDWVLLMEYKELSQYLKPSAPKKPKSRPKELADKGVVPEELQSQADDSSAAGSEPGKLLSEKKEEWYILKGSDRFGPFSYREVVKMLQDKQIYEFDYVWKTPMETWNRIAELECFQPDEILKLKESEDPNIQQLFFRRRHARVQHGASLIVHDNQKVWKGESLEVSEAGAGIQMYNSMLLPGQKVFVHFKPSDGLPSFNAMCEIVNKKFVSGVRTQNTPILYGVRFISINGDVKNSIRDFASAKSA